MKQHRTNVLAERGVTLLEVLLAVALLSLAAGAAMGAASAVAGAEARGRERLAAYEVANRLLLQYLDDDRGMPPKSEAIAYGSHRFFWDVDETGATMVINRKQESAGANLQAVDRYRLIGVSVYAAEGAGEFERRGDALAFLSRVLDPFAPRNPDSLESWGRDPGQILERLRPILQGGAMPVSENTPMSGRRLR